MQEGNNACWSSSDYDPLPKDKGDLLLYVFFITTMYIHLVLSASTLHCPSAKCLSAHKLTLDIEDSHYNIEVCSGAVVEHQPKKTWKNVRLEGTEKDVNVTKGEEGKNCQCFPSVVHSNNKNQTNKSTTKDTALNTRKFSFRQLITFLTLRWLRVISNLLLSVYFILFIMYVLFIIYLPIGFMMLVTVKVKTFKEVTTTKLVTINCRSAMVHYQLKDTQYCQNMMRLKVMGEATTADSELSALCT